MNIDKKIVSHKIVQYHYLELEFYCADRFVFRRTFGDNPTWEAYDAFEWEELDDTWPGELITAEELEQLFVEYQNANMHISCANLA